MNQWFTNALNISQMQILCNTRNKTWLLNTRTVHRLRRSHCIHLQNVKRQPESDLKNNTKWLRDTKGLEKNHNIITNRHTIITKKQKKTANKSKAAKRPENQTKWQQISTNRHNMTTEKQNKDMQSNCNDPKWVKPNSIDTYCFSLRVLMCLYLLF